MMIWVLLSLLLSLPSPPHTLRVQFACLFSAQLRLDVFVNKAEIIDVGKVVVVGILHEHIAKLDFDTVDVLSRNVQRQFAT